MSYDLNIGTGATPLSCNHQVVLERYVVSTTDWITLCLASDPALHMASPLNAKDLLQVYIGGILVAPTNNIYGYSYQRDPSMEQYYSQMGVDGIVFYKIVFNKPVRILNQIIEVNYYTFQQFCRKCNGSGYVTDYQPATSGSLIHIFGNDKLVQKCLKWILTSKCVFYPQFVCALKNYLYKKFNIQYTDADISQAINTALTRMQSVQTAQGTVQNLDAAEVLAGTGGISASEGDNPTEINVTASVSAAAGSNSLPLYFTIFQQ